MSKESSQNFDSSTLRSLPESIQELPSDRFPSSASFVIVLRRSLSYETIEWLIGLFHLNHFELSLITDEKLHEQFKSKYVFLISCNESLLEQNVRSVYNQLERQTFSSTSNILNTSEKQRILHHLIQTISLPHRDNVVGLVDVSLYPGQSIIEICCYHQIITDYFPLHDYEYLEQLRKNYCSLFGTDLDYVRNYFGEMIGFYFAFLNSYKKFLTVASFLFFTFLLADIPMEFYTMIACFGCFVFIKLWKRQSKNLALKWGTIELLELEKARPAFRSKGMQVDAITHLSAPYYPIIKTWCKEYFISIPFVIICLCLSFELMCLYFDSEKMMLNYYNSNPTLLSFLLGFLPSIAYALIVMILNHLYIIIATKLNNYENHKTQASHENHLIVKLVLFEFFNNFISLFYIAFYLKDMTMLKYTLITMLTVNKMVENCIEVFIPMLLIYRKNPKLFHCYFDNSWREQIAHESRMFQYEHTYNDCLELFIQFGYTFLFLAIWPWAPIVAAFNSILEVRMDAMKLCFCNRRPFHKSMKSINEAWIKSFEVLSIIAVISNLLVLGFVSERFHLLSESFDISKFELVIYSEVFV
ncbi:hypothetical protein SSS_05151 [Sarcoptes scabiei]|nr:hypothetical protein SSS_05151 [Sarcoptes scabiei]